MHAEHGHLQEVILQNFVPHRRYYGEEPAEIATEAAEAYWRTGLRDGPGVPAPEWASPVTLEDMRRARRRGAAAAARRRRPGAAEPLRLVAGARRRRARPTSAA